MDSVNPNSKSTPSDEVELQNYQDDLDTSSDAVDPIMNEESDDPTEGFGVAPEEFKRELDQYAFDGAMTRDDEQGGEVSENGEDIEDRREDIEALGADSGDTTKYS